MYSRITTLCHVWPGLTPLTVWDLPYDMWLIFARAVDAWVEANRKEG